MVAKIPYPHQVPATEETQPECTQHLESAKKNFFHAWGNLNPWEERKDDKGNNIPFFPDRIFAFIKEMLISAIDLALSAAWGVYEYGKAFVHNIATIPSRWNEEEQERKDIEEKAAIKELNKEYSKQYEKEAEAKAKAKAEAEAKIKKQNEEGQPEASAPPQKGSSVKIDIPEVTEVVSDLKGHVTTAPTSPGNSHSQKVNERRNSSTTSVSSSL